MAAGISESWRLALAAIMAAQYGQPENVEYIANAMA